MFSLFSNLKLIFMGLFSALLPLLYVLGRRDAKQLHEKNELQKDILNEQNKSDFYKAMEQDDEVITSGSSDSRDDLLTRLRNKGI